MIREEEKTEEKSKPKQENSPKEEAKRNVAVASQPLKTARTSEFSIHKYMETKEEEDAPIIEEELPVHHFSETDLQTEWKSFLKSLAIDNPLSYLAISPFELKKIGENSIEILYTSETAKKEFEEIQIDFFNRFKQKVNNFKIELVYKKNETLKREFLTKRKIFENMAEINPVLKDLEDLVKFDFS